MPRPTPNSDRTILIASSSRDKPAWGPVAEQLSKQGYDVVTYRGDAAASGRNPLDMVMDSANGLRVYYDGRELHLDRVAAAWYRRPTNFVPEDVDIDHYLKLEDRPTLSIPPPDTVVNQLSLDSERAAAQEAIWENVPENAWLGSPKNMREAQGVMRQLRAAQKAGMTVLKTIVTNSWSTVNEEFPGDVVFKAPEGTLYTRDDAQILRPTRIVRADRKTLEERTSPYPGYWQEVLTGVEREWRIAFIGSRAFDVAIYPPGSPGNRMGDDLPRVRFSHEPFPDEYKERCLRFLVDVGLRYGEFNFAESSKGITLVDFSPNPQIGWMQDTAQLQLPISQTIADELAATADRNRP